MKLNKRLIKNILISVLGVVIVSSCMLLPGRLMHYNETVQVDEVYTIPAEAPVNLHISPDLTFSEKLQRLQPKRIYDADVSLGIVWQRTPEEDLTGFLDELKLILDELENNQLIMHRSWLENYSEAEWRRYYVFDLEKEEIFYLRELRLLFGGMEEGAAEDYSVLILYDEDSKNVMAFKSDIPMNTAGRINDHAEKWAKYFGMKHTEMSFSWEDEYESHFSLNNNVLDSIGENGTLDELINEYAQLGYGTDYIRNISLRYFYMAGLYYVEDDEVLALDFDCNPISFNTVLIDLIGASGHAETFTAA